MIPEIRIEEFNYDLPDEKIAKYPLPVRDASKLLYYKGGIPEARKFTDIPALLPEGSMIVFNDTKVVPARLHFQRDTGAHIEVLLLKRRENDIWETLVKPGKKARPGTRLVFGDGLLHAEVLDIVEKIILFFRDKGVAGERFADTISRIGFEEAERIILGEELLENKEKIILGIDPGYGITGFGLIEADRGQFQLLRCGAITTPPNTDFSWRLEVIYNDMVQLLKLAKPDVVAIEELFFGQNVTTGIGVAQSRGVILLAIRQAGLEVTAYKPMQVKQAVVGYGNATKHQVMDMTKRLLKLKATPKPDDAADALAIALCHHYQLSNPLAGVSGKTDWKKFLQEHPDRIK